MPNFGKIVPYIIRWILGFLIAYLLLWIIAIIKRWHRVAIIRRNKIDFEKADAYIARTRKKISLIQYIILGQTGEISNKGDIIFFIALPIFTFVFSILIILHFDSIYDWIDSIKSSMPVLYSALSTGLMILFSFVSLFCCIYCFVKFIVSCKELIQHARILSSVFWLLGTVSFVFVSFFYLSTLFPALFS